MGSNHQHDGAGLLGLQQVDRARPIRPDPEVSTPPPRIQLTRALAKDLGPGRALMMLIAPTTTHHARERLPWTA
jgi:hypothetical protein